MVEQFALTAMTLVLCSIWLWWRISAMATRVRFSVVSGNAHALDANVLRPRFALRGHGFDLGELPLHDSALAISPGHAVSAVYAHQRELLWQVLQPALLFNHVSARWRSVPGTWAALRGDAASHFFPVLLLFIGLDVLWMSSAASDFFPGTEHTAYLDATLRTFGATVCAFVVFALLSRWALRALDRELERRALVALHEALFVQPWGHVARQSAHVNLAEPRTRYAPQGLDLIVL